ncbi:MAG TPA: porin, partial [Bradyrhizobium sp.]
MRRPFGVASFESPGCKNNNRFSVTPISVSGLRPSIYPALEISAFWRFRWECAATVSEIPGPGRRSFSRFAANAPRSSAGSVDSTKFFCRADARSVEYVKVCSLYGAGFYYMPGTDLCIKIGGWVRAEETWGGNGSMTWGPFNGNVNNRLTSNEVFRARGYITADVRNQTEYGTVRGYLAVGINTNDTGLQVASLVDSANRAFV